MQYLNRASMESLTFVSLHQRRSYPWANIRNTLPAEASEPLRGSLPDVSLFNRWVRVKGAHGPASHDQLILHYNSRFGAVPAWNELIAGSLTNFRSGNLSVCRQQSKAFSPWSSATSGEAIRSYFTTTPKASRARISSIFVRRQIGKRIGEPTS